MSNKLIGFVFASVALQFSLSAHAAISGPTTGFAFEPFTLTFSTPGFDTRLKDVSTGALLWGPQVSLTKPAGTYVFEEHFCFANPFGGGAICSPLGNTHTISIAGAPSGPQTLGAQSRYQFQARTGDFDGNGRTDILLERVTSRPPDGSLSSVILSQSTSRTLSARSPTPSELGVAQTYPINTNITSRPVDLNADGFADRVLSGLGSVGVSVPDYLVFAPGPRGGTTPLGIKALDDATMKFLHDIVEYFKNPNYFAQNGTIVVRTTYRPHLVCPPPSPLIDGGGLSLVRSLCIAIAVPTGVTVTTSGVHADAQQAVSLLEQISNERDWSGGSRYWALSQILKRVLGSHAFGFDDNGVRRATNNAPAGSASDEEVGQSWQNLMTQLLARLLNDTNQPGTRHEWSTLYFICAPNSQGNANPLCTTANVWCLLKKWPAPRERQTNPPRTIRDGEASILAGGNPIQTFVYESEYELANVTLQGHILHNPNQPADCPRRLNESGVEQCSQTYRQVVTRPSDGAVMVKTTGHGYNPYPRVNEIIGPQIFTYVDQQIQNSASPNAPGGMCVNN